MTVDVSIRVVFADGRVLIRSLVDGCADNVVDVCASDSEEVDMAIGMVTRSVRRQMIQLLRLEASP